MIDNDILNNAVQEISRNHRKIIDDWCKAYLSQLYEENIDIKPGCFTLVEQQDLVLDNGKLGKKYWFKINDEKEIFDQHPWDNFLKARAVLISWLAKLQQTDQEIADQLSMEEEQVRLIRNYVGDYDESH